MENEKIFFGIKQGTLEKMLKYFFVSGFIVVIEMSFFVFLNNFLKIHYLFSVVFSFLIAVILNWYLSRMVFQPKDPSYKREILLVGVAAFIGGGIQFSVAFFCVEYLKMLPVFGKILSMAVTFFWNFWFRIKFVFK